MSTKLKQCIQEIEDNTNHSELMQQIIENGTFIRQMDNTINENNTKSPPSDSNFQLQHNSFNNAKNDTFLIDIHSKLMNLDTEITKDLTNNLNHKQTNNSINFNNDREVIDTQVLFPACNIRGIGKNRWYKLPMDPQLNSIEPFNRIGENTVNNLLDTFKPC